MKCVFTIDVEDWFHILDVAGTPDIAVWDRLPSRVEADFRTLLDIFKEGNVRVTCFFLGWVAQRFPHLVRLAIERGHEAASHGYSHRLVYEMTESEFQEDAVRAKRTIEDAAGLPVRGYRASGFSVTTRTPWFFDALAQAGYSYDSSVFPGARNHGGMAGAEYAPHAVATAHGPIVEFPITLTKLLSIPICLFGGGYLRLAPWALIRHGARQVVGEGRPVVFYVHPREIDPDQPRLPMSHVRAFKSYVNLRTTEDKIRQIVSEFQFVRFEDLVEQFGGALTPQGADVCGS
jgi:polysaccharide deacetylase family protein (PEP-CTERM system associated)